VTKSTAPEDQDRGNESLPFAAPCKKLETNAPIRWVKLGWQDLRRAPIQSISYGAILVIRSYLMTFLALAFGNLVVLLALLSGFIFLGPILARTVSRGRICKSQPDLSFRGNQERFELET